MARDSIPSQRIFKTSPFESIDYELHDGGIGGDDDLAVVKVHELRIGDPYWEPDLVGSCHGLVCLLVPGRFFLYNPTTKESRNFPCSDLVQQDALVNGFGYDPRSDDYKIVQAGGVLFIGLGIHGANLFIYRDTRNNDCIEVWITNEYGRGQWWTKWFNVSTKRIPGYKYWQTIPVAYTRSGKIVFLIEMGKMILFIQKIILVRIIPSGGRMDMLNLLSIWKLLFLPILALGHQ
ncbi:hypothetical protein EUGRSUZ_H02935 [Eucalyptus grandis]|uniref:Uncharacterized protein n=2 Tax=Eucalyptus grandis TaxID=71139 RepID=A0ACC3JSX6_EUCGR|nr:hypothetical protein EUGRSUZ_H02935 [Eucalyptus grandis]